MFASFLPSASNLKLGQNGAPSSKASNRFSVRVFKTQQPSAPPPPPPPLAPPPSFPLQAPASLKVDPAQVYRAVNQREQVNVNTNWYPPSNPYANYDQPQRPRAAPTSMTTMTTTNYAIYPSAANDGTFIYEQSACSKSDLLSNSELDSPTTTEDSSDTVLFSPAMSTDSTITLPRTIAGDRSVEDLRLVRSATPAPRAAFPPSGSGGNGGGGGGGGGASTSSAMARVGSTTRYMHESAEDPRARIASLQARSIAMHAAPGIVDPMLQRIPSYIPEYAESTFSEQQVNARDVIAKRNAELNSTPTASYYSSSAGSGSSNDGDRRRMPSVSTAGSRVASSQASQSGINFPTRAGDFEYAGRQAGSALPFPSSKEGSPPRVERLPSHFTSDGVPSQNQSTYQAYPSFPQGGGDTWTRDAPQSVAAPPYNTSPKNSVQFGADPSSQRGSQQSIYAGTAGPIIAQQDRDRAVPGAGATIALERSRSRRISIVGGRPDLNLKDQGQHTSVPRAGPDARQFDREDFAQRRPIDQPMYSSDRRDIAHSPPRGAGAEYRRDSRTPSPREREREKDAEEARRGASRRDSYALDREREAQPRQIPDARNKAQAGEYIKSVPLSSSPTELEPLHSRYAAQRPSIPPPSERAPMERTRLRSISFSSSTRPVLPLPVSYNGQVPPAPMQPYPSMADYRGKAQEPMRLAPPQAPYYSQVPTEYQQRAAAAIAASASRALDRVSSAVHHPHPRDDPPTRARTYPDPAAYSVPQPHSAHAEPVRRHSDGDNPYERSSPLRSSAPYSEKPILKVMNPSNSTSPPPLAPPDPIPLPGPEPQRRNSDGDQNPPLHLPLTGRSSAPLLRVRWTDNLVCPSPIPTSQRRKGWFNRRGDQLWTNDGAYKAAPAGQEYPPDLDDYPECNEGWMNEECIRIDLTHRLIPKPPLRSALKCRN